MMRWGVCCLLILLGALQVRLWSGEGSIQQAIQLRQAVNDQSLEVEKLSLRNLRLERELHALKTVPEALEERARSELGMIKRGETFYLVIEPH